MAGDPRLSAPEHNRSSFLAHPVCPSRPAGGPLHGLTQGPRWTEARCWSHTGTHSCQSPRGWERAYSTGHGLLTALARSSRPPWVLSFPGQRQSLGPAGTCRGAHGIFGERSCFCRSTLPRVDLKTLGPDFQLRHQDPCPLREKAGRLLY